MLNEDCFVEYNNQLYGICRRLCDVLKLRETQFKNESEKIRNDPFLSRYVSKIKVQTNGGIQEMLCLKYECLNIWLCKINLKSLNEEQYEAIIKLINELLDESFIERKNETSYFDFESHLRDELFNIGKFKDYKIIDKEVIYDFGRIDLLATDINNNKICIELKKFKEFDDTKSQLLRYRDSNKFDKIIYMAFAIDEEFNKWCKNNQIEIYTYKRKLEIEVA